MQSYTYKPGSNQLDTLTFPTGTQASLANGYSAGVAQPLYDPSGNVTSIGHSAGTSNPQKSLTAYTAANLPQSIISTVGVITNTLSYLYGPGGGRVKEISDSTAANTAITSKQGKRGTTWYFGSYEIHHGAPSTNSSTTTPEAINTPTPTVELRHLLPGGLGVITLPGNTANGNTAWTPTNSTGTTYNAPTSAQHRYHFKDYLGSLIAITDGNGNVTQRMKYDVWGQRTQLALTGDSYLDERGFTGHEHLEEVGLIHMNGRIYDPQSGRFLQADPIIQSPLDGQNYDRYQYVFNNPLSLTDPSGYWSIHGWHKNVYNKFIEPLARANWNFDRNPSMSSFYNTFYNMPGHGTMSRFMQENPEIAMVAKIAASYWGGPWAAAFITGYEVWLAGGSNSAITKAIGISLATSYALQGAGAAAGAVGSATGSAIAAAVVKVALHAAIGCASASASGGSCRTGAISYGFSAAVTASTITEYGQRVAGDAGGIAISALAGGIASKLGGGSFEQGALNGAMGYVFNKLFTDRSNTNHKNFVLSNPNAWAELRDLNQAIIAIGYKDEDFTIRITGGDRYLDKDEAGNYVIKSRTDDLPIQKSSPTSNHLESNGARGIDITIHGVSLEDFKSALATTNLKLLNYKYEDGHLHLDLPVSRWYSPRYSPSRGN